MSESSLLKKTASNELSILDRKYVIACNLKECEILEKDGCYRR